MTKSSRFGRAWRELLACFIVAVLFRLVFVMLLYGNYDMMSYQIVVNLARFDRNIYALTDRYNYSPLWFHILLAMDHIHILSGIPFQSIVRGFMSWIDLVDAAFLGLIADRLLPGRGRAIAIAYAFNVGAVLISGYHGQFDALAILPILIAVYGLQRYGWGYWGVLLLMVAAVVIKHNSIIVVWALLAAFFGYKRAILGCLLAVSALLLTLLPYLPYAESAILSNVLFYAGVDYGFGLGAVLPRSITLGLMGLGLLLIPRVFRRQGWVSIAVASILVWYVSGSFAMQYMTYILIFGALLPRFRKWWIAVGILVSLQEFARMVEQSSPLVSIKALELVILWGIFAFWLIYLVNMRRAKFSVVAVANRRTPEPSSTSPSTSTRI